MIRTRDFFLLITIIVFLLVGIGSTLAVQYFSVDVVKTETATFVLSEDEVHLAKQTDAVGAARAKRLQDLRQKIADGATLYIYEEEPVEEAVVDVTDEIVEVQLCSSYRVYQKAWNPSGLIFREVEGARLLYREIAAQVLASTTIPAEREVLVQLAIPTNPLNNKSCLQSDVVGLTIGGGLIRNNEFSTYAAFGPSMLIGYALDGFPIYGGGDSDLDSCGGRVVNGQYRYQVSTERASVLQCYSGLPVVI